MVAESKEQGSVSSGEETMAKNIQISLAARVQEASARFRKKQSTYLRSMFFFTFIYLSLYFVLLRALMAVEVACADFGFLQN
jgi:hypothetical protein